MGYIIGPKIAGELTAGGVLSQLVLVPLIAIIGEALQVIVKPGAGKLIAEMSAAEIRGGYVRYIGAGAVAAAGLITLISTLPTIVSGLPRQLQEPARRRPRAPAKRKPSRI